MSTLKVVKRKTANKTVVCYNPVTQEYHLVDTTVTGGMEVVVKHAMSQFDKLEQADVHVVCVLDRLAKVHEAWPAHAESVLSTVVTL
jgi:hypothetical protein